MNMTANQFFNHIKDLKGCNIISVEAETPKGKNIPLNKTNIGFRKANGMAIPTETLVGATGMNIDNMTKYSVSRYLIGKLDYQDLVNNRLLSEAQAKGKEKAQLTFSKEERKWGKRVTDSTVTHKGNFFVTLYPLNRNKNIIPFVEYRYNGVAFDIKDEKFNNFRSAPKTEGANQGTETAVLYRDFGINSFLSVTLKGEKIKIVPE